MTVAPARCALTRRLWLAGALALAGAGGVNAVAISPPVVTILGDSITAGLGLTAAEALPAALARALRARGAAMVVRGAGVSGDTSAGGLARLDFSVRPDTRVCVVALGGNDLLRGLDPAATQGNLTAMVRRLKARRIAVVLAGVRAPAAIGPAYARAFNGVFAEVAGAESIPLLADLLAGVSGRRALLQADGLHPNAAGAALIAQHLAPLVIAAARRGR